ncbi:hypothetical protein R70723_07680 [Paenibacillus sp. FSL R7-0273]|uniref:DUF4097 family beta strand repeat-containing protein n=1 Tax=Paenibacillus sp. FSL R7-0273 TaxID=1536772 RepID=UPI0004F7721E|nr:DUF4097 family beta strand repeat-containing protein [Paenibacillus sp. FSL R7-0273]AIQ45775.1 hypothetical protein R70723_07680 [Paenibacillus sp. FSL R7-0273]OMF95299.1 hypothetical protein BK144_07180 [Paenibacillus sp. FSL R7-0273]
MRKRTKVLVVLLMLAAVGIVLMGYTHEQTVSVNKSWELTEAEASRIEIKGLSQNLDVHIRPSSSADNRVEITGSLPESFAQKIEQIQPDSQGLSLSVVSDFGFSMAKFNDARLTVNIYLADLNTLNKLVIQSNRGEVKLHVPETYERKYQLLTNNGTVTGPAKEYDVPETVKIELGSGDIEIIEE